ncbi:MAG: DUF4329 domain-containing protein [Rhodospirillaceae bacterium]|nr:DUF4329 domain-containing protein [Rhodospirillaceae bacterium]
MRLLALASVVSFAVARAAFAQDEDHVWLYEELDTLALRTLDALQHTSIAENREYCGYLGVDASGQVAATPAVPGTVDSCLPDEPPEGFEIYASYHTHGAYSPDEDSEVPSYEDLQGDIEEGVDGYIATPGGRVWLNLYDDERAAQLCGPGCVFADPNFLECGAYPPQEEYTLDGLQARFDNDPGYC